MMTPGSGQRRETCTLSDGVAGWRLPPGGARPRRGRLRAATRPSRPGRQDPSARARPSPRSRRPARPPRVRAAEGCRNRAAVRPAAGCPRAHRPGPGARLARPRRPRPPRAHCPRSPRPARPSPSASEPPGRPSGGELQERGCGEAGCGLPTRPSPRPRGAAGKIPESPRAHCPSPARPCPSPASPRPPGRSEAGASGAAGARAGGAPRAAARPPASPQLLAGDQDLRHALELALPRPAVAAAAPLHGPRRALRLRGPPWAQLRALACPH